MTERDDGRVYDGHRRPPYQNGEKKVGDCELPEKGRIYICRLLSIAKHSSIQSSFFLQTNFSHEAHTFCLRYNLALP